MVVRVMTRISHHPHQLAPAGCTHAPFRRAVPEFTG